MNFFYDEHVYNLSFLGDVAIQIPCLRKKRHQINKMFETDLYLYFWHDILLLILLVTKLLTLITVCQGLYVS